jgi:hypothetical protein
MRTTDVKKNIVQIIESQTSYPRLDKVDQPGAMSEPNVQCPCVGLSMHFLRTVDLDAGLVVLSLSFRVTPRAWTWPHLTCMATRILKVKGEASEASHCFRQLRPRNLLPCEEDLLSIQVCGCS